VKEQKKHPRRNSKDIKKREVLPLEEDVRRERRIKDRRGSHSIKV